MYGILLKDKKDKMGVIIRCRDYSHFLDGILLEKRIYKINCYCCWINGSYLLWFILDKKEVIEWMEITAAMFAAIYYGVFYVNKNILIFLIYYHNIQHFNNFILNIIHIMILQINLIKLLSLIMLQK